MNKEELKKTLEKDGLFRKDGGLNTAWIHNRAKNYDFSNLDGDSLQEKLYLLYHNRGYCRICGKPATFRDWNLGYPKTCSKECKKEFDRRTLIEKAVPKVQSSETQAKRKKTCIEKYGVDNPFKSQEIKDKIARTNLSKFGVEHPAQNKAVRAKMEATNKANHNGRWNLQLEEVRTSSSLKREALIGSFEKENNCTEVEHLIKQYGQGWLNLNLPLIKHERYKFVSNEYLPQIQKHYREFIDNVNHAEQEVYEYCRSILPENAEIIQHDKSIVSGTKDRNLELDIYIPSKNVAIEYNGIYWHAKPEKNYHLHKTEECEKKGIRLIHIWEDLWYSKKNIYKSIIASALGVYAKKIYARDCVCEEIFSKEYEEFLSENHIQGPIKSKIRLGLFYNDELVQVAGWGKSRFKENEYELHRMCSKLNIQVIGGFSKLIKHSNLNEFISFVSRDLYNGKGYESTGFKILEYSKPGYFYCNSKLQRVNRMSAQKHKLSKMLEKYDPALSEVDNMMNNGYFRIYDCGNIKVEYKK